MFNTRIAIALCAGAVIAVPARADIVSFDFTGTVTSHELDRSIRGMPTQPFPFSFIGLAVSGSFSIDLGAVPPDTGTALGHTRYAAAIDYPSPEWITVTVQHPDGRTLLIPSGPPPDPRPIAFGFEAQTEIYDNSSDRDRFYAWRSNSDARFDPRQIFELELESRSGGFGLLDSSDYRNVQFDLAHANASNFGNVMSYAGSGDFFYDYRFTVNSLTTSVAVTPVPEPATWMLMAAGVALLCGRATRGRGDPPVRQLA